MAKRRKLGNTSGNFTGSEVYKSHKYEVSAPTICAHTRAAANGRAPKSRKASVNGNGLTREGMDLGSIIQALKKRRDGLNAAIEALES